jgi:hypothetical protein
MCRRVETYLYIYLLIVGQKDGLESIQTYNLFSEWLLFNANSAIFQLYHGESKLVSFQWNGDEVHLLLHQHSKIQNGEQGKIQNGTRPALYAR